MACCQLLCRSSNFEQSSLDHENYLPKNSSIGKMSSCNLAAQPLDRKCSVLLHLSTCFLTCKDHSKLFYNPRSNILQQVVKEARILHNLSHKRIQFFFIFLRSLLNLLAVSYFFRILNHSHLKHFCNKALFIRQQQISPILQN